MLLSTILKHLTLSSRYNFTSGYGELLYTLLTQLPTVGYNVVPRTYTSISDRYINFFDKTHIYNPNLLDLSVLCMSNDVSMENGLMHMKFDRPRILLTMWESTRINDLVIEILNNFKHIIVPNNYNKYNFINQGLNTKIDVVPLFCDTDLFIYKEFLNRDKFVFGISNEDPRKNLNKIIKCFLKAFNGIQNVELQIKTCTSVPQKIFDSRLKYIGVKYTKEELRDWYYNLDIYVSGATCEGWGMMQQESLCCGRPIIYTNYGGLKEFVNNDIGFEVEHDEVYSTDHWGEYGAKWSDFKESDMIEKMLYCYKNREEVVSKGKKAALVTNKYNKDLFIKNITGILNQYI
jgi:glycosyltransferase involved in cell wall biosynthesis